MEHPGDPIPGSAFVRDFCASCHEPIRVTRADFKKGDNVCADCDPDHQPPSNGVGWCGDEDAFGKADRYGDHD